MGPSGTETRTVLATSRLAQRQTNPGRGRVCYERSVTCWRDDRIGSAERGTNPTVLARMTTGWAVIGDIQHLPGYCLLLHRGPADHLTDLPRPERAAFLLDLSLLGEAVQAACRSFDPGFRRINYEVLGNSWNHLHGHIHARYDWEPAEHRHLPVWRYNDRTDPRYALGPQHEPLRRTLVSALHCVVNDDDPSIHNFADASDGAANA